MEIYFRSPYAGLPKRTIRTPSCHHTANEKHSTIFFGYDPTKNAVVMFATTSSACADMSKRIAQRKLTLHSQPHNYFLVSHGKYRILCTWPMHKEWDSNDVQNIILGSRDIPPGRAKK